ncbi:tRNA dihydrouridine(20/20a) synthase DusA [Legionella adelaidensis]|nr:tRNA dihydrouridine(20/20a) synthase DusA [Legionella adelaidensis]
MTYSSLFSQIAIAPMIDWTNTHFRIFMRLLAPQALLYTDMQTPGAIFNNPGKALYYQPVEHPLALQLGGSVVSELVECAKKAEKLGFKEINLNLGCPSDRVLAGKFGACLMSEPNHVAECIKALKESVSLPVTAKTRIGIDNQDSYSFFSNFVFHLVEAGCDKLIVHARKAWLKGLSPKQNRTIPPLHYDYVYAIKKDLPHVPVVINGNIKTIDDIRDHLEHVDGVMLGRLVCDNPYAIAEIHKAIFPEDRMLTRAEVVSLYVAYIREALEKAAPLSILLKPLFNLMHGLANSKAWKAELLRIQQQKDTTSLTQLPVLIKNLTQAKVSIPN